MKTIIFHSYKGGQGRTTCLANLAACLYRLGKRACLVDLDIESPGLPPKFEISAFGEGTSLELKGGVFNHLFSLIETEGNADVPLSERCIPLGDDEENNWSRLVLLPTYHIGRNYFQNRRRQQWRDLMVPDDIMLWKARAFQRLQDDVKNLPGGPEYLLIDLPSGITHLAETVFTVLAETVVLFFSLDKENLEGARFVNLRALRERIDQNRQELKLENRDDKVKLVPVISRQGPFLSNADIRTRQIQAAKDIFEEARVNTPEKLENAADEILIARADPDLDREWHLHIKPNQEPIKNVALTRDYLEILARIDPELGTASQIALELGLPDEVEDRYKMFRLDNGVMVNLTDESADPRNVSFKVRTFCSILDDIHDQILSPHDNTALGPEEKRARSKLVSDNFRHAGHESGKRFGLNLIEMWKKRDGIPELSRRLTEWCAFDSQVGFGHLNSQWRPDSHGYDSGTVEVASNFLADRRAEKENDLCALMIGYVQGVLECILESDVDVKHPNSLCMRGNPDMHSCIFTFTVNPRVPGRK